jgi:hypothetical protein
MNVETATLDELGLKYGTDKASSGHNYLKLYERYLAPIRHTNAKILEIGVLNGASLAVWEAYLPNGTIIGADINIATRRFARPRVAIEIINQSDIEQLTQLGIKHGPFDVIIEDGSHFWEHQITSLKTLFPFVKNGGIYIVEDLQTNYGNAAETYRGVSSISCVEYLKKLVDLRVGDNQIDIASEEDPFLRTYGRAMQTITFYRRACIIEKNVETKPELPIGDPILDVEADNSVIPVFIFAHVGNQGDRTNPIGWMRTLKRTDHIQGFAIETLEDTGCDLLYRACLANGEWTGWKTKGEMAGTRGKSESLTGFAVRLADSGREDFSLEIIGEFSMSSEPVTVRGGEDCIPIPGGGALIGMQVILRKH